MKADHGHLPRWEQWGRPGRQGHQGRQAGCTGQEGLMEPLESVLGRDRKNPSFPTFLRVVPESSMWSQDPTPPAPGSWCPAQEVWDQLADGQKVLSLSSQQDLRLSGSKRERGPHARPPRCPQKPVLPATRGGRLRSARASSAWPAGIRVLSPGTSPGCRAGRR